MGFWKRIPTTPCKHTIEMNRVQRKKTILKLTQKREIQTTWKYHYTSVCGKNSSLIICYISESMWKQALSYIVYEENMI